ncbi:MAG: YraN family protein [Clostridiales Family XIII bacterium]|jgi:putative endonuclease|nr:YraN family protein [Clostridiales Family XIII bacterium]
MSRDPLNNKELGALGEEKAAAYLKAEGYDILFRNYSCRSGEIDIIAHPRGKNVICFTEVKTRTSRDFGRPAEAVSLVKQKHIRRAATYILLREWENLGADAGTDFRFDVVEVDFAGEKPRVHHIPAAFS